MHCGFTRYYSLIVDAILSLRFSIDYRLLGFSQASIGLRSMSKITYTRTLVGLGAAIGKNPDLDQAIIFYNSNTLEKLFIGDNCHLGKEVFIDLKSDVHIGNNCTISMQTMLLTHIDVGRSKAKRYYSTAAKGITIEDDVYIGARAMILPGVVIGKESVIAAGAVVNKSVPARSVIAGVPGRIIKELRY